MKDARGPIVMVAATALILGGAALTRRSSGARETGRGVAARDTTAEITVAMIDAGRKVYRGPGRCWACHGKNLEGGVASPELGDDDWRIGDGSYEDILEIVQEGVPGTSMQPHEGGIGDAQARSVAAYVWAVSHGRTAP
jgi:mono/diheme cytochrome c family protein